MDEAWVPPEVTLDAHEHSLENSLPRRSDCAGSLRHRRADPRNASSDGRGLRIADASGADRGRSVDSWRGARTDRLAPGTPEDAEETQERRRAPYDNAAVARNRLGERRLGHRATTLSGRGTVARRPECLRRRRLRAGRHGRRAPRVPASVGIPSVLDEDVCARTGALRPGARSARRPHRPGASGIHKRWLQRCAQ